jgi:hypothetical protein
LLQNLLRSGLIQHLTNEALKRVQGDGKAISQTF